ncbi:MAG: hypothetical protein HDKAJFGB_00800 [Anaerolineae bacterium]|nr:hypothetical protein [Anaerolineae bacterium]
MEIRVLFDEQVDILTIRWREGDYDESDEITEGVIVDFDKAGKPMAIEILDASKILNQVDRVTFEYARTPQPA